MWVFLKKKKLGGQRNNHLECGDGRIIPPVYRSNDTHVDREEEAVELVIQNKVNFQQIYQVIVHKNQKIRSALGRDFERT